MVWLPEVEDLGAGNVPVVAMAVMEKRIISPVRSKRPRA